MQIESGETLTIRLEPISQYDFHEKPVALQALGSFVAGNRDDQVVAQQAADLGCRLATLRHTEETDGQKIVTEAFTVTDDEIRLLGKALSDLANTTSSDIRAIAQAGNLHGCSVRCVEGSIANDMFQKLTSETSDMPVSERKRFKPGFAQPTT